MIAEAIVVAVGGGILLAMVGYTLSRPKAPQYAPEPVVEDVPAPVPEPVPPPIQLESIEMDFWQVRQWADVHGFHFTRWADLDRLNEQRVRMGYALIVRRSL